MLAINVSNLPLYLPEPADTLPVRCFLSNPPRTYTVPGIAYSN